MYMTCARWISVKQLVGDKMNWALFLYFTLEHWFFSCKISQCKKKYMKFLSKVRSPHDVMLSKKATPLSAQCRVARVSRRSSMCEGIGVRLEELCSTRGRRYCSTLWYGVKSSSTYWIPLRKTVFPPTLKGNHLRHAHLCLWKVYLLCVSIFYTWIEILKRNLCDLGRSIVIHNYKNKYLMYYQAQCLGFVRLLPWFTALFYRARVLTSNGFVLFPFWKKKANPTFCSNLCLPSCPGPESGLFPSHMSQ